MGDDCTNEIEKFPLMGRIFKTEIKKILEIVSSRSSVMGGYYIERRWRSIDKNFL